jgi:UDP-glucose 4-epimerase
MNIMVTGGAGYIGSHTVRELVKRGNQVLVLDNLSRGHEAAVKEGFPVKEIIDTAWRWHLNHPRGFEK